MREPGVYTDISIEDYHNEHEYISASRLKLAKKSLKLFKMSMDGKLHQERKAHFDFGNAFELALLDPDNFDTKVANEVDILNEIYEKKPDTKSPRATTMYRDWMDSQDGKYVIHSIGDQSFETIRYMLESCYQDETIQRLIKNVEYQYSIYFKDRVTGLNLKTRPDICKSKKNVIVDVKTALDGSPEQFARDCANNDYPLQACMQIDGALQSGFMSSVDNYFWLVCEKEPPYSATLYEFAKDDIQWCMDSYNYVKGIVARAIEENKFPSYSQRADNQKGILTLNLPLYYKNQL